MSAKGGTIPSDGHMEVTEAHADAVYAGAEAWIANDFSGACPVRDLLDRIGDKWSVLIILRLGRQTERLRALLRAVDGISQRLLTMTLRGLERDGLVHRQVFDTRPPSVAYKSDTARPIPAGPHHRPGGLGDGTRTEGRGRTDSLC